MDEYENCTQCLDTAEKMPHAITAQEAVEQRTYLKDFHAEHTSKDD